MKHKLIGVLLLGTIACSMAQAAGDQLSLRRHPQRFAKEVGAFAAPEPVLREEWPKGIRDPLAATPSAAVAAAPRSRADPARYAKKIAAFAAHEPAKHGIVFIGSSATTRWNSLSEDFPDLPVINRAFGGSRINDLIVYFNTIVLRHEPHMVVIDIGGNDINAGLSVDETFADYQQLLNLLHDKLPRARVVINSLGISIKRIAQIPQVIEMNGRLSRWAKVHDWARYVDRTSYQLGPMGKLNREHYVDDLLHPSRVGYEEWIKVLGPTLREEWSKVPPP